MKTEPFNLNTFSFKTENPRNILEQIKNQEFYQEPIVQNLVRFFEETNASYIPQMIMSSSVGFKSFQKIYPETCWGDISQWYCHTSAPYFALEEQNHNLLFGFCHQFDERFGFFSHALLHSFVVSSDGTLRDPHLESIIKQQKYFFSQRIKEGAKTILTFNTWCNQNKINQSLHKDGETKILEYLYKNYKEDLEWRNTLFEKYKQKGPKPSRDDFSYYFGTKIPLPVIEILFRSNPKYPKSMANLWGYLKNNIFISNEKTDWFIGIVENEGKGFAL